MNDAEDARVDEEGVRRMRGGWMDGYACVDEYMRLRTSKRNMTG
jgi:hypothetical protein